MKQVFFYFAISPITALRIVTPDAVQYQDLKFTIGVITFPAKPHENETSIVLGKENSVAALWNARREHTYDIQISLTENPKHHVSIAKTNMQSTHVKKNNDPFGDWLNGGLIAELMKDLPLDDATKLKSCGVNSKPVGHLERAIKNEKKMTGPGVWVILCPETVRGKELARYAPEKSIILGSGYDEVELEKFNINGRKVHNLWFPFGLMIWNADHSPMVLMNRDGVRAKLLNKSNDLSVVYQQSKCYAEREEGWDELCEQLNSIGQKCYIMGQCNGNEHLGVSPPFASAGSRSSDHWADAAIANYKKFKFVYALEHSQNSFGYVTEKLFLPIQAGAIPIYTGDKHALDVLGVNPKSYIYVTPETRTEAFKEVRKLLKDDNEYQDRITQPVIHEENFKKFFTFHSSTWPKYGDQARQKFINAIADACNV